MGEFRSVRTPGFIPAIGLLCSGKEEIPSIRLESSSFQRLAPSLHSSVGTLAQRGGLSSVL